MINRILEPLEGFTKAYKNVKKLNNGITFEEFLYGVKNYKPILFRQFYEMSLHGVPNKSLKQRIRDYGN